MRAGRLLDRPAVEDFDRALSERAPAIREKLAHPGLEEHEIRDSFASVGVRPSREALIWWGYFDAQPPEPEAPPLEVLPDFQFVSVEMSLHACRVFRSIAEENARSLRPPRDPEEAWGSQWAPIFATGSGGEVVLDCSGPHDAPSPVRVVYADTIFSQEHAGVFAPSFGQLLVGATRWMERRSTRYDVERMGWVPLEASEMGSYAEMYGLTASEG